MSVETKLARFFSTKHACERMTVVTQEGTAKTAAVERQMRVVWQRSSAANVLYFPFSQATPVSSAGGSREGVASIDAAAILTCPARCSDTLPQMPAGLLDGSFMSSVRAPRGSLV